MSDFKIHPALCFKPTDIITYLGRQIKDDTLHNELVAALVYRLVIEKIYGWSDYFIYFEPRDSRHKELLELVGTTIPYEDLPKLLEKNVNQQSPFDVLFVRKNVDTDADVRPVQLKRFGIRLEPEQLTEKFIEYLDKLKSDYSPVRATLFVHLENRGTLNFGPIVEHLKLGNFPFEDLQVFAAGKDGITRVCQLYPPQDPVICVEFSHDEVTGK